MKYLKLIKFKHFIKNFIIFIPLILSYNYTGNFYIDKKIFLSFISSFVFFCFISQFVYLFNDYVDKDKDVGVKKNLYNEFKGKKFSFLIFATICLFLPYLVASKNSLYFDVMKLITIYLVLNIFYTIFFKNYFYLGLTILSSFFVIRLYMGISILDLDVVDFFLQIMIVFLAGIYIGAGKRFKYKKIKNTIFKENEKTIENFLKILFLITNIFMLYFLFTNQNLTSFFFTDGQIIFKRILLSLIFVSTISSFHFKLKSQTEIIDFIDVILDKKLFTLTLIFIGIYIL